MLSIFFIGIALSMDAFSVAISVGTQSISKVKLIIIPIIIGIFHLFMPLIGVYLGNQIINIFNFNPKLLIIVILSYLIIVMYLDRNKENKKHLSSIFNILLLAFSVSLDSFSVGLGLSGITSHYFLSSLIFCFCSALITYMGFIIGKYSVKLLKNRATYLGIIILLIIVIVNVCQLLFY